MFIIMVITLEISLIYQILLNLFQIKILSSINQIIFGSIFFDEIIEITTCYCTCSWYCQFLQSKNLVPYPL